MENEEPDLLFKKGSDEFNLALKIKSVMSKSHLLFLRMGALEDLNNSLYADIGKNRSKVWEISTEIDEINEAFYKIVEKNKKEF